MGQGDARAPSPTYWTCRSTWWTLIFIQEQILLREKEHGTMFHTEQPGSLEETCRFQAPGLFSIRGPKCHSHSLSPCKVGMSPLLPHHSSKPHRLGRDVCYPSLSRNQDTLLSDSG